ncbi:MAG: hypothetical protein P9L96_04975 [Candidatus Gygaella obscura]|nr:hypothetical protein [Candidatus Gygaella obscura]
MKFKFDKKTIKKNLIAFVSTYKVLKIISLALAIILWFYITHEINKYSW